MDGYVRAMGRYATFQGRASRAEFWQFFLALMIASFVTLLIDGSIAQEGQKEAGGIVTAVLILVHLLPYLAVTVRRLHDTERAGWLVLLNCLPVLNLVLLVLLCLRGTPGANRFGPDPYSVAAGSESPAAPASAAGGAPTVALGPSANPARRNLIAELERLGRLRQDGHLSEAEFEVMKAETLAQGRSA